jgi:hypothetical protein
MEAWTKRNEQMAVSVTSAPSNAIRDYLYVSLISISMSTPSAVNVPHALSESCDRRPTLSLRIKSTSVYQGRTLASYQSGRLNRGACTIVYAVQTIRMKSLGK